MSKAVGRNIPLSRLRRAVADVMDFFHDVPLVAVDLPMELAPLVAARQVCTPRPTWTAIFMRAFSLVALRRPEFRRAFLRYPWPHLYEHPHNIATFTVERRFENEEVFFVAHVRQPEQATLGQLDAYIRRCQQEPPESIRSFRRALLFSKTPWLFRRLALSWLQVSGSRRAQCLGTFGTTSAAGVGVFRAHSPTPVLHYGRLDRDGILEMRLTFDHRIMDGGPAARALVDLRDTLQGEILSEVRCLATTRAA